MLKYVLIFAAVAAIALLIGCSKKKSEPESGAAPGTSATQPDSTANAPATSPSANAPVAPPPTTEPPKDHTAMVKPGAPVKTPDGLEYTDTKIGTGATARPGAAVRVHYTGWLTSGKKFDSSVDRHEPFTFVLGRGDVIKGWDEGVAGMKVGGKRKLRIPPALGYGAAGAGGVIPPNATLIFDIELLGLQ